MRTLPSDHISNLDYHAWLERKGREKKESLRVDWSKVVTNAVTVLVATVFLGAAMQLWTGVQTIDSRIDSNLADIRATQDVLAPKVDLIEARLSEILPLINPNDKFPESDKGTRDLINERVHQQIQQSRP